MITDAGSFGELNPVAGLPSIQSEGLDALAEWQILAQTHHVKTDWAGKLEDQLGRRDVVISGPIPPPIAPEQIFGGELLGLAADIAGLQSGFFGKVSGESGLKNLMKLF
jgi:hypothetical protein